MTGRTNTSGGRPIITSEIALEGSLARTRLKINYTNNDLGRGTSSSAAHLGLDGPFQVIGLDVRDIAYAGAQNGGRLVEGTSEVKEFIVKFDRIGAKAASEDGSRAIIEQYLETYS